MAILLIGTYIPDILVLLKFLEKYASD